jgi:GTP-binding protein
VHARGGSAARVSRTPGRTQSLNFFDIRSDGDLVRFVDLPGYGFAKVPPSVRQGWERLVGDYLRQRASLRLVIVLVDLRHDANELDRTMVRWVEEAGRTGLLLCTKADQVPKSRRLDRQARLCKSLDVPLEASQLFSSTEEIGRDDLWKRIREAIRSEP